MIRILIYGIFLHLVYATLQAQVPDYDLNRTKVWYFGIDTGLSFQQDSVKVLHDGRLSTIEGSASISDTLGNLLFYTDGITVWNRQHKPMPNGQGLKGHRSSTQSALIVPKPGSNSRYYLFTADAGGYIDFPNDGINYSEVEMCLQNGLGDIVATTKNTLLYKPATEKLAATYHRNGTDVWVMTHRWKSNEYVAYLVTEQGVSQTPVVSPTGLVHQGDDDNTIGQMKFSPDGTRMGLTIEFEITVEVFDFDAASGQVSNPLKISSLSQPTIDADAYAYGLEFSHSNRWLYVGSGLGKYLYRFDLWAGGLFDIRKSVQKIYDPRNRSMYGSLQWAPNGKLYVARPVTLDARYLGEILHPDSDQPPAFNAHAVDFVPYQEYEYSYGLPNFISSYFDQSPRLQYQQACGKLLASFSLLRADSVVSYTWNFGDSLSVDDTSSLVSPTHHYSAPGNYTAHLQLTFLNGTVRQLERKIIIQPQPTRILGNDTLLCAGTSLPLDVSAVGGVVTWQDGSHTSTFTVTKAGTYWVDICRDGCSFRDTIQVNYLPVLQVNLGPDRIVCDAMLTLPTSFPDATYQWSDGSRDSILTVSETGTYWVRISHACGTVSDTVHLTFEPPPVVNLGSDTTLCVGDTLRLDAHSANSRSYRWSNGSTEPTQLVTMEGRYWVEVTNQTCIARDTVQVHFEECAQKLFIPNVFTPNGDGHNETFEIAGILLNHWRIEIHDRWGKQVYQNAGYRNEWDAQGLANGVYYYVLRRADTRQRYRGWIEVLR